jgi:hypothetical protein
MPNEKTTDIPIFLPLVIYKPQMIFRGNTRMNTSVARLR